MMGRPSANWGLVLTLKSKNQPEEYAVDWGKLHIRR
jgi:hypothetical protein